MPPVFPGCQVTKYSINGGFSLSLDFLPVPVHARFGAYRAAERPIDIRRSMKREKPFASARAGSCTVAGDIPAPRQQGG